MKTTSTLAAALLAALACHAQEAPQGPPPGHPPHPPMPILEALDTDGDDKLSAGEIEAASGSLRTLDTDGDGTISKEELRPKPPAAEGGEPLGPPPGEEGEARPPRGPVPPLMAVLDANRDRELSSDEIEAAPSSLAKLDKNADGELTPRELHPPRPRRDEDVDQQTTPGPPPGGGPRPGGQGRPPRGR
jgi:hypothetical protein